MAPFGRQWFSLQTAARATRGRVRAAEPLPPGVPLKRSWRAVLPRSALALTGFSQGAMMPRCTPGSAVAEPPAAILAYSARCWPPRRSAESRRAAAAPPPVLLVHGEVDGVVPVRATRMAEAALRAAGVPVEALYLPGLDHSIDDTGLAAGLSALLRAFGLDPPGA
jgi:phospholipase/carboxylesterase